MFQLTQQEFVDLRAQIVTSSWGDRRGVAVDTLTQSVLKADRVKR